MTPEQEKYRQLQSLYGDKVLPNKLIEFFSSLSRFETTVRPRPGESMAEVRAELLHWDHKKTYTEKKIVFEQAGLKIQTIRLPKVRNEKVKINCIPEGHELDEK